MSDPAATPDRKRTFVISGVNMTEGGILSVLRHVTEAAERVLGPEWRIVVLAHRRALLATSRAEVFEFPAVKASWFRRLWFEWRTSRDYARRWQPEVWFAAHDITPLVEAPRQYVYCHNPTCFSRPTWLALYFDWIFVAHSLLYGVLYSLNIRRNTRVFVQQSWIRDEFLRRFRARSVTVARPMTQGPAGTRAALPKPAGASIRRWIYPTFPRHFKNVEVVGRALEILESKGGPWGGEVRVTIGGDESRYARYLKRRFAGVKSLKFVGRQDAAGMSGLYDWADGLLFPSRLETWGLPISEAQQHRLPLLVADLKYAHETVGDYNGVTFFDPTSPHDLAALLHEFSAGRLRFGQAHQSVSDAVPLEGWDELVREMTR